MVNLVPGITLAAKGWCALACISSVNCAGNWYSNWIPVELEAKLLVVREGELSSVRQGGK